MRKVVKGVLYDTSTAEEICDISGPRKDPNWDVTYEQTWLYRDPDGRFFIAGEGWGRWQKLEGGGYSPGSGLKPVDEEEAARFVEEYSDAETYERLFRKAPADDDRPRTNSALPRRYYSVRSGRNPPARGFQLDTMRGLFRQLFIFFEDKGYFREALGYNCPYKGFVAGTLGLSIDGALRVALRKHIHLPIRKWIAYFEEEDLFDVIEFLYDHCSQPTERHYYGNRELGCWRCDRFDRDAGRAEFRQRINELLEQYERGFELSEPGEVLALADPGLASLHEAPLPTGDVDNVGKRVAAAVLKFRRHRSTFSDQRDAIRDLADVLEFLRPQLVLTNKDDAALFNIANNLRYGITTTNSKAPTIRQSGIVGFSTFTSRQSMRS